MKLFFVALSGMVLLGGCSVTPGSGAVSGRYLMLFETCLTRDSAFRCDTSTDYHQIRLAESGDGVNWSLATGFTPVQGTHPAAVRRGNYIYVYGESNFFRRFDVVNGIMEDSAPMTLTHSNGVQEYFANPALIVDGSNRLALFYLIGNNTGDDATACVTGPCTKTIRSATEDLGSNGSAFTVDSGSRAQVTLASGETLSDPTILSSPVGYLMYLSKGQETIARYASGLKDTYADVTTLVGSLLASGVGEEATGYYESTEGEYWTYLRNSSAGVDRVQRAKHGTLGVTLDTSHFTTVLTAESLGLDSGYSVENPVFLLNTD